jgi:LPXTG-site transpeptidase (sortase) family protein
MDTWSIIYEYCDEPTCAEPVKDGHKTCDHKHTVVVAAHLQIPQINLLKPFQADSSPITLQKHVAFNVHKMRRSSVKRTLTFRMPIPFPQFAGLLLLVVGLGGALGPLIPELRLEAQSAAAWVREVGYNRKEAERPLPESAPIVFEPLKAPDGTVITPINNDFSIIIPKIGVNAPVIGNVDPTKPKEYDEALLNGVAHASTSFFPDQNGTVYLFSHSTNYAWFVKDLNAVFYLVKDLDKGDSVVLIYKGMRYTYRITDKEVVASSKTGYLIPYAGKKSLILETCWPPGSVAQRLLIFADLVETKGTQI